MWDTHNIISAAAGGVSLVLGLLMWFFSPSTDRNRVWHDPAVLVLVFAGGAGIKNVHQISDAIGWCLDKIAGFLGGLSISIGIGIGLGIIAFAVVFVTVQQMREKGVLPWMLVAAVLVPFLVGSIPGWIGVGITWVLGWIAAFPAWIIAAGFGIS